MADYLTTTAELTSVADAIRQRGGTSALLSYPEEYIAAILAIPSGGDTVVVEYEDANGHTVLEVTGVDLSRDTIAPQYQLQGYTAHDRGGNAIVGTQAAADDSNFIITLTRTSYSSDADQMWEPDCTFAEAKAAYDAGKTIIFYADYGDEGEKAVLSFYVEEIQSFQYAVLWQGSYYQDSIKDSFYGANLYEWNASEVTQAGFQRYHRTDNNATAAASDVISGKVFYTSDGVHVGTLTLTQRTSSDLTVSGATVTVPAGNYATAASASVASGSATTPATSITANPSITVSSAGLITATVSGSQSVTPTVSAGYVSSGTAGTVSVTGSDTEQLTVQAAKTVTPTKSSQTAVAAGRYTTGAVTVAAIPSNYIDTTDATASATSINAGETAYVDGVKITGTQVIQTYYTGSSTPSSSLGSNGDIYLEVVS